MTAPTTSAVPPSRIRAALSLGISGGFAMFAALLAHEILTFGGAGHDLINADRLRCPDIACPTTGMIVIAHIAKAVGATFLFAIIGAIWADGLSRPLIASAAFALQYLWSLVGIASGYRIQFGTTWAWWEPFGELLWHPVLTPCLLALGLALCLGLDRLLKPPRR